VREQWVSLKDGGSMDVPALGFLSDMVVMSPRPPPSTASLLTDP
jgi:hypothetical protein